MRVRPGRDGDQTGVQQSLRMGRPKGLPLYVEANGAHKGVAVIGTKEMPMTYKPYCFIHSSRGGMKSQKACVFVDKLKRTNCDKEVWVILDNYQPHISIATEYESKYQGGLGFLYLPSYWPELAEREHLGMAPGLLCPR